MRERERVRERERSEREREGGGEALMHCKGRVVLEKGENECSLSAMQWLYLNGGTIAYRYVQNCSDMCKNPMIFLRNHG